MLQRIAQIKRDKTSNQSQSNTGNLFKQQILIWIPSSVPVSFITACSEWAFFILCYIHTTSPD